MLQELLVLSGLLGQENGSRDPWHIEWQGDSVVLDVCLGPEEFEINHRWGTETLASLLRHLVNHRSHGVFIVTLLDLQFEDER